jgi:hypothetical protein
MRIALVLCLLAAVVGCGVGAAAPNAEATPADLKITVWPEGRDEGSSKTYTLECVPARGSLPKAASACTRLLKLSKPFTPVPQGSVCTEQYGGPQQALVTGEYKGRSVWVIFSATDGCQIARSKRVSFILPGFGNAAG